VEAAGAASPAVRTLDLTRSYGRITALAGLNLQVERGEVFGFLGPNGAGKTTAVKVLMGLVAPTAGEGWVLGLPIGDPASRRRLGYLPELFRYQGWLSAREVLALHCSLARLDRSGWAAEIDRVLEVVGLSERAADRVAGYSKGMQQRLGLGVALLGRPELVLLDEPTSALDPVGRHDVRELIRGLRAEGCAVFLNSHLLSEVEQVCDRVAVVNHGRVIATGTLDELLGGHSVRLRVAGLSPAEQAGLARFGRLEEEAGWLVVQGCDPERVPDLVAAAVGLGGRVYAVEPRRGTLEDRFLELLGEEG
jgi:ABC-2 type transport system ATP-binding protein